jgi:hypothetical protein
VATVILISPRDGGTYGTQADGSLVPFTATGFVDVPGQVVSIYEDATSALLGSGVASSSPQPSGTYAGWYAWTVPIASWSSAAGVFLPTMAGAGALVFPTFAAAPPLPSMAGVGGMSEPTYSSGATFSLPSMAGAGGMTAISITAVVGLPAMAAAGAMVPPTITFEAGGGGATTPNHYAQGVVDPNSSGSLAGDGIWVRRSGEAGAYTGFFVYLHYESYWEEYDDETYFVRVARYSGGSLISTSPLDVANALSGFSPAFRAEVNGATLSVKVGGVLGAWLATKTYSASAIATGLPANNGATEYSEGDL